MSLFRKIAALLALVVAACSALPAQAYDPAKAPRYGTADMYRLNADAMTLFGAGADGNAIGFTIKPTGALMATPLADQFAAFMRVESFKQAGDPDDSAAFRRAFAAGIKILYCTPNRTYVIGLVDLSNSQVIDCAGANLKAAKNVDYMLRLLDYKSEARNLYIADGSGTKISVLFGSGYNSRLQNSTIINAQTAIAFRNTAAQSSTQVSRPVVENVLVDTYTKACLDYGPNVAEINSPRVYCDAGTVGSVSSPGKQRPKPGTYGLIGVSTGTTLAAGGHMLSKLSVINAETGIHLEDAQFFKCTQCLMDSLSGHAVEVTLSSSNIDLVDLFVGTTRGNYVGNASQQVAFTGLRTILTGFIPPWGGTDFWDAPGPFFDMTVGGTASVVVDVASWRGGKQIYTDPTAHLALPGAQIFPFQTPAPVASGSTSYIGQSGIASSAGPGWVVPFDGTISDARLLTSDAPGNGQSYTYDLLVNGVLQATMLTSAGGSYFGGQARPNIPVTEGDLVTARLSTSAGAYVTNHRGFLRLLPP